MTEQQTLGGDTVYLSRSLPGDGQSPNLPADHDRERYCLDCRHRVTLSEAHDAREYGHAVDCPHSCFGRDRDA